MNKHLPFAFGQAMLAEREPVNQLTPGDSAIQGVGPSARRARPITDDSLRALQRVASASAEDFEQAATDASVLGSPAVPRLMLIARDAPNVRGALCAVVALSKIGNGLSD